MGVRVGEALVILGVLLIVAGVSFLVGWPAGLTVAGAACVALGRAVLAGRK